MTTRGALFLSTQVSVGLSVLKAMSDSIQAISVACKGAKKGAKLVKQMTMRTVKVMPNKSTTEITSTTSTTSKTVTKTKVCAWPSHASFSHALHPAVSRQRLTASVCRLWTVK